MTTSAIRVTRWRWFAPLALCMLANLNATPGFARDVASIVTVVVDNTKRHQTMEGFGATHVTLVDFPHGDRLSPALRAKAIDAVYKQVGLTTGNVGIGVFETPADATDLWKQRANDDDDPFHYNWSGFNFSASDAAKRKLIDLAKPLGFDDFYLELSVNVRWECPWLKEIRARDYNRYLEECAEHVLAGQIHWRDAYGIVPRYVQILNEPTSGSQELDPGSIQEVVDIIKRTGERLRKEGFPGIKFVVPGEETEERSLDTAAAILADPVARQYVGAIAYHPYPYGSTYSLIRNILNTSGRGKPDPEKVSVRNRLRDLGKRYGIPVWMTEVSHGGVPALSFDGLIGRAIHIHDELVYADAAAYFAMGNMSHTERFTGHMAGTDPFAEEGSVAIIDVRAQKVFVTGMGYAIGHYARWIGRGAIRIGASSSDPLLQVTAFRDDRQRRLVLVLINNADHPATLNVHLKGFPSEEKPRFRGEQSTAQAAWTPIAPFLSNAASRVNITVPAKSVTTLAGSL